MMGGWYDVQNNRYSEFGYVDNIEMYGNDHFCGIPTANAVLNYLKTTLRNPTSPQSINIKVQKPIIPNFQLQGIILVMSGT